MAATTVKERPILFSGEMVRAILDGRKTQTRRIVKSPIDFLGAGGRYGEEWNNPMYWGWETEDGEFARLSRETADKISFPIPCPYGEPGHKLWVREGHWRSGYVRRWAGSEPVEPEWHTNKPHDIERVHECIGSFVQYGDDEPTTGNRWKRCPSIHMPRWASRITLEIVSVRVERLQDISENDAIAEGLYAYNFTGWGDEPGLPSFPEPTVYRASKDRDWTEYAVGEYRWLWESFNGPGSWDANPWVWAIEFRRVES